MVLMWSPCTSHYRNVDKSSRMTTVVPRNNKLQTAIDTLEDTSLQSIKSKANEPDTTSTHQHNHQYRQLLTSASNASAASRRNDQPKSSLLHLHCGSLPNSTTFIIGISATIYGERVLYTMNTFQNERE
jgi:hypothetical protein